MLCRLCQSWCFKSLFLSSPLEFLPNIFLTKLLLTSRGCRHELTDWLVSLMTDRGERVSAIATSLRAQANFAPLDEHFSVAMLCLL